MSTKKVGILTMQRAINYGAVLQAYALKSFLDEQGFDAKVVDYRVPAIEKVYNPLYIETSSPKTILKNIVSNVVFLKKNTKRRKTFKKFIENNLSLTGGFSAEELKKSVPDFDILITGSDQVWNEKLTGGVDEIYTLQFGPENIKRISYAASLGRDEIDDKKQFAKFLNGLDDISVREENMVEILQPLVKKKITTVSDPVFLLSQKQWSDNLGIEKNNDGGKYVFCYELHKRKELCDFVNYIARKENLRIIYFTRNNHGVDVDISESHYEDAPDGFLRLLANAKYVVTDSFHGTALSVIFRKNFWAFSKGGSNARIAGLLDKIGLSDRFISRWDKKYELDYAMPVGYDEKKINSYIEKSKKWLLEAIKS